LVKKSRWNLSPAAFYCDYFKKIRAPQTNRRPNSNNNLLIGCLNAPFYISPIIIKFLLKYHRSLILFKQNLFE